MKFKIVLIGIIGDPNGLRRLKCRYSAFVVSVKDISGQKLINRLLEFKEQFMMRFSESKWKHVTFEFEESGVYATWVDIELYDEFIKRRWRIENERKEGKFDLESMPVGSIIG